MNFIYELLLPMSVTLVIFDILGKIVKVIRKVRELKEKKPLDEAKKTEGEI